MLERWVVSLQVIYVGSCSRVLLSLEGLSRRSFCLYSYKAEDFAYDYLNQVRCFRRVDSVASKVWWVFVVPNS